MIDDVQTREPPIDETTRQSVEKQLARLAPLRAQVMKQQAKQFGNVFSASDVKTGASSSAPGVSLYDDKPDPSGGASRQQSNACVRLLRAIADLCCGERPKHKTL